MSKSIVVKMCVVFTESGRKKHGLQNLVLADVFSYAKGSGAKSKGLGKLCCSMSTICWGQEVCGLNTNLYV